MYNEEHRLDACLSAIRRQDYPQDLISIFCVDGGSTDRSLEVAQEYGATCFKSSRRDQEYNRAWAVPQTHSEIVAFLDADNLLPHPQDRKSVV